MTLTKKNNGKREAKAFQLWTGVNKTTPHVWFERWTIFCCSLMGELGFTPEQTKQDIPFKKPWFEVYEFTHDNYPTIEMEFTRKRIEEAGTIIIRVPNDGVSLTISTLTQCPQGYAVQCRTTTGNEIIGFLRDYWLEKNGGSVESNTQD